MKFKYIYIKFYCREFYKFKKDREFKKNLFICKYNMKIYLVLILEFIVICSACLIIVYVFF